jgi:hypothetical protein
MRVCEHEGLETRWAQVPKYKGLPAIPPRPRSHSRHRFSRPPWVNVTPCDTARPALNLSCYVPPIRNPNPEMVTSVLVRCRSECRRARRLSVRSFYVGPGNLVSLLRPFLRRSVGLVGSHCGRGNRKCLSRMSLNKENEG